MQETIGAVSNIITALAFKQLFNFLGSEYFLHIVADCHYRVTSCENEVCLDWWLVFIRRICIASVSFSWQS